MFEQAVTEFKNDPSIKVLLISLKAGGVALNLTVANHIFLMGTRSFMMLDLTFELSAFLSL